MKLAPLFLVMGILVPPVMALAADPPPAGDEESRLEEITVTDRKSVV